MYINNKDLSLYGGKLEKDYTYTPPRLKNEYFFGRKRSSYILLDSYYEPGSLKLPIAFRGCDQHDTDMNKSSFEREAFGKSDIHVSEETGDIGYFSFLESISDSTIITDCLIKAEYTFSCIKHGKYRKMNRKELYCESTLPYTDCILSVTVGSTKENYKLGSVTFTEVSQGEKLVVDGINKRILVDGAPAADRAEWIRFPYLVPGLNNIECDDEVTVEYYPVFF